MDGAPADASARLAAERAARESYGRLLAYLAWQWRDIAAAEDALADAFASALSHWPRSGVPAAPEAWLLTAARRQLLQAHRHARLATDPAVTILLGANPDSLPDSDGGDFDGAPASEPAALPDARLKLLFVCAHPAISPDVRTALMLQTVLGLDARRIAAAFLVSPAAMAQRLVRAKKRITLTGMRFEEPEADELPERIHAVLEAIYAIYGFGWDGAVEPDAAAEAADLTDEALFLAELCVGLLPASAEAAGLLALLLLCESRRAARTGADGAFVPLHQQDASSWNRELISRADQILWLAAARRCPGPFQLEAAIQAAHCHRAYTGQVPWAGIAQLYDQLIRLAPTTGAQVARAVAIGEAQSPAAGLAALRLFESAAGPGALAAYQPFWVAQAYLLARSGLPTQAAHSYRIAMGLTTAPSVHAYLQSQLRALDAPGPNAGLLSNQ